MIYPLKIIRGRIKNFEDKSSSLCQEFIKRENGSLIYFIAHSNAYYLESSHGKFYFPADIARLLKRSQNIENQSSLPKDIVIL